MDAGFVETIAADATDDQLQKDAHGLVDALGSGSWVAVALFGAALVAGLVKKFKIGQKNTPAPVDVKPQTDASDAKNLLKMEDKKNE